MTSEDPNPPEGGAAAAAYEGRAPVGVKTAFGIGSAAETIPGIAFQAFNFFFYTNILGLSGTLTGVAVAIALAFDAVSDPVVGALSDRWHSRLGRRHPFMFAAPLPVMICLFLLYNPPQGLGEFGLFAWLTVLTVVLKSAMTLFIVPHLALGAELSADFTERSRVMSVHALLGTLGALGFTFSAYSLFFGATPEYANGLLNPAAYSRMSLGAAFVAGGCMLLSALLTMNVVPRLSAPPADLPRFSVMEFLRDCKSAVINRNYVMLMIGSLLLGGALGTRATISLHMNTYFWELGPEQIRYFSLVGLVSPLVAFFVTAPLHEKFGKKHVLVTCLSVLMVLLNAPLVLWLSNLMPANGSDALLWVLIAFYTVGVALMVIMAITAMSALADIADEQELISRRRQEGVFYSARSFFTKATAGLGALIGGTLIDAINFPVGAEPGSIGADTVLLLGIAEGPLATLPGVLAIIFYAKYSLSRQRLADIQAELALRRQGNEEQPD